MIEFLEVCLDFLVNRPLLLLVLMAVPLMGIARYAGLYPTRRLLWMVSIPALVSVFMIIEPTIGWYVLILDAVIFCLVLGDLVLAPGAGRFSATRNAPHIASLGKPHEVELTITNASRGSLQVDIQDDLPDCFEAQPPQFLTKLEPRSRSHFHYRVTSNKRGPFELSSVYLKVRTPLGLWSGYYDLPCQSTINVYPDMKQISEYELLARTNRLSLVGVRRSRKIGQDNEFERLRDYTQDDNFKHIDWRTTARRQKLTVKDYQSSQSQRIIFMVDCGRMMTGTADGLNMLDHSLNAMLMLSYIALKQGDSVGLICFSDTIHNYTPPRNGVNHINRLLNASFSRKAEYVESNYNKAFLYLSKQCHKRSLVVLMTNVIDDINAFQIKRYLGSLAGRHLPLGILLRDHEMFDPLEEFETNPGMLYEAAAASQILSWRHQVINDLKHAGVLALDVFPEKLTANLVNRYLDIKARSLL